MNTFTDYQSLAFFDLDGTLLNAHSTLDGEVVEALAALRAHGVLPIIATGRGAFELPELMATAGITGAITLNGQYIVLDGQPLYAETIAPDITRQLLETAEACGESIAYYDATGYHLSELTDAARQAYSYTHAPIPTADHDYYLTHDVHMLLVISAPLTQVAYYQQELPALSFFKNSPWSIDVTNVGTNKGTGIARFKEALGFTGATYGFGDGRNDIDLLKACDHKTAMGNAVPELKRIADFVTTDNTDHGIVTAFKHWGLI